MPNPGVTTLATIRTAAQQRADMVNSSFLSTAEWNSNINASYQELYDLLIQKYGNNYYVAKQTAFTTDGINDQYALPDGSGADPAFYKLLGVDLLLSGSATSPTAIWTTMPAFNFAERNRFAAPNVQNWLGRTNLRYRLNGSNLWLTPFPASGQSIRCWYAPRLTLLASDTDTADLVSGWEEFIVVDSAIKALQKEESDVSVLMAQKTALTQRIEAAAENRDAGSPATVSDSRSYGPDDFGGWGSTGGGYW